MKHTTAKIFSILGLLMATLACTLSGGNTFEPPTPTIATETISAEPITEEPVVEEPHTQQPIEEPEVCAPDMMEAQAFLVTFCYPSLITTGFTQEIVPEKQPSLEGEPWDVNPTMIEITLTGYPVSNMYHQPRIFIYPVQDYISISPNVQTTITDLQALLISENTSPDFIPFAPVENAAQMMRANVSYLTFHNGRGVRFITQYSQGPIPISNDSAVYAFMGLTDDGEYLISATFPVAHPLFYPDMLTEPPEGWMTFAENLDSYLRFMESELPEQPLESFTPNLQLLDEMMRSFTVPPNAIP